MKSKISARTSGKKATKAAASTTGIVETKVSQLEKISVLEVQEEQRVMAAKEKLEKEEISAEQAMHDAEKHAEETLRTQAREELSAYKSELTKVLADQEKETEAQLKKLDAHYSKHAAEEAARLIADYLHSHAAA